MQAGSTRRSAPMVVEEDPMPFPKLTPRTFSSIRELNGISARTMEEHYELYKGYVAKTNEIQDKLGAVDRATANQVYSDLRALRVELSFATGGVKNHERALSTQAVHK